jgi:translation initiation factor 2A
MPSKASLFDHRANPIYDFPQAARNFVAFNPHGRVICIAGFGNLAGEIVSSSSI